MSGAWSRREAAIWLAALLLYVSVIAGFVAQAAYVWFAESGSDCYVGVAREACHDTLSFFGSEQGEVIAVLATASLSVAIPATWLAYQIRFRLPALWRAGSRFAAETGLREAVGALGAWVLRKACRRLSEQDAKRVHREFEQQRLRRAQAIASKSCPFFVVCLLYSMYFNILDRWEDALSKGTWSMIQRKETVPLLVITGIVVIFDLNPSALAPRSLDCANALVSCMWAWKLFVIPPTTYSYDKYWMIVGRVVQASVCGNVWLTVLLNVAILIIDSANMHYRPAVNWPVKEAFSLYRETFVVALVCVVSLAWDQLQWAEAKLMVKAQKSDHSSALVRHILSCMCDAVPRLDRDLRLTESCPSLSTLLLRDGPIAPGVKFADLILPEDTERFCTCLEKAPSLLQEDRAAAAGGQGSTVQEQEPAARASAFAGLCHVRLRGANGFQLPVSVFYSCAPDADGQPTFLLGIREDFEEASPPAAMAPRARPSNTSSMAALEALPEASVTGTEQVSSSAWSSVSAGRSINPEAEDAMALWADAASPELRVLSCSVGFALLGGASGPCGNLAEWMSAADVGSLREMLHAQAPACAQRVRLRPPVGGEYKCEVFRGDGHDAPELAEEVAKSAASPAHLVFTTLHFAGRRKEARASQRHGGRHRAPPDDASWRSYESESWDIAFTVQIANGVRIGSLLRGDVELLSQFRDHRNLLEWLEDPAEFLESLVAALRSDEGNAGDDVLQQMGTFALRNPDHSRASAGFLADVFLLSVSEDEHVAYPILLGIRQAEKRQDLAADGLDPLELIINAQVEGFRLTTSAGLPLEPPQLYGLPCSMSL